LAASIAPGCSWWMEAPFLCITFLAHPCTIMTRQASDKQLL
jgi:hypothetical protein